VCWLAGACSATPELETLPIGLRERDSCRLDSPSALELRALGDFPSQSARSDDLALEFDFPSATRELSVRAEGALQSARGRRLVLQPLAAEPLWLLPEGRSCPHGDAFARAPLGAALAALPAGGLLIAGGRAGDGAVSSDALRLGPGAAAVEPVVDGMLLRREWASATPVDGFVVIAGGSSGRGDAHETYEVFDAVSGRFVGARSGKLKAPRSEHGAALLPGGLILFAGGRAVADGPPLATADLLDFGAGRSGLITGEAGLREGRSAPVVLGLDSGSALVLGGRDRAGGLVHSVERFDPQLLRFAVVASELPDGDELVAAALPGGRAAWLICSSEPDAAVGCKMGVLLEQASEVVSELLALDFAAFAPAGLAQLQLLALESGQLLLTAADPSDPAAARRAFALDLNVPELRPLDASRVPSALLLLRTGQVAELDADGLSLREESSLSAYESPRGELISGALALIALDSPEHWQREPDGLRARLLGAQLDVPALRFEALRLSLDSGGDVSLSFLNAAGERSGAELVGGRLLAPGCSRQLPAGAALAARVDGSRITFSSAGGAPLCEAARPAGALRVSLRAAEGTLIRSLELERL
jgi:hypothetical protein